MNTPLSLPPPDTGHIAPSDISSLRQSQWLGGATRIFSRDPVIGFMIVTFSILVYVFYTTEFRDVLENYFFDVRTRWMQIPDTIADVTVVAIDDDSIERLNSKQTRISFDRQKRPYLTFESMIAIASLLANSDATAIALLMPDQAFPHADPRMNEISEIVKYDRRMVIGTMEYNQLMPSLVSIPDSLTGIDDQVFGFETFRRRSNAIVRSLRYTSYRGLGEKYLLPVRIASQVNGSFGEFNGSYYLNQVPPSAFTTISAADLIERPLDTMPRLANKIVVVGYTSLRDAVYQTSDMFLVNTPLMGDEQRIDHGEPLTYLTANAIENLIHDRILRPAPPIANFVQTVLVATICGLVWELGSLAASIYTAVVWLALIGIHSYLFGSLHVMVPLADTFIASTLVAIFAAVRRLKTELQSLATAEADSVTRNEIARMQANFLDEFASWLKAVTTTILDLMRRSQTKVSHASLPLEPVYQRAFAAGEDFAEYLESIRQIPEMEHISTRDFKKETIDLDEFLQRIVRRFEIKIANRHMTIAVTVDDDVRNIRSNPSLLDSIIFNFVSNAVKYSGQNTTIQVKARRNKSGEIVISVLDEGPGIPEELRERIFEKFYRIRDDRVYLAKGTGLGLYLCRFFAEHLGGHVECRSEVKRGAEFRVILP